jgi:histidinol-phosphate phosphatase family protein
MPENLGNRGLFCDLAGTLVRLAEDRELPVDAHGNPVLELLPGVAETLHPIHDHLIFVVTNQAAIARNRFTLAQMEDALARLDAQLGGILTGWQICPHAEQAGCACRKPGIGMIQELTAVYGVELPLSTMVGDQQVDEQCARAAGIGRFVYARDFFKTH